MHYHYLNQYITKCTDLSSTTELNSLDTNTDSLKLHTLHLSLSFVPSAASILRNQVPRWKADGGEFQAGPAAKRPAGILVGKCDDRGQHRPARSRHRHGLGTVPTQLVRDIPCCTATSMNTISSVSLFS